MIPNNEAIILYHGSKSGIQGPIAPISRAAAALDDIYDRLQWAGEEYILEELIDEIGGLKKAGTTYSLDIMYWTGYTYRYWHYYTAESSTEIYKTADARTMQQCWAGFHTFDVEMAIDDLKELYKQSCTH